MSISFKAPEADADLKPRIVVVGVGGAGGNAVNNMIRSNLEGVEFVVANTDAQALKHSQADRKIQLGVEATQGLGAGARPEVGREAAIESMTSAMEHLSGANMIFITAGMGGGTGTGAAPVLAEACRDAGMLTVGVVTKPFQFEGAHRMRAAEQGIEELQQFVDTLIIIPNQNLFRVANEKTTFADAFKMADDVLYSGVRGVTDLMVMPGLINLDFADIRTVMSEMGKAMMGTGEAEGETRAIMAAESAISNPLLEDVSMKGARGVLINITGGSDMTLFEVDEAANRIREEVDSNANIIFGSTFEEDLDGKMRVSVVATGIESEMGIMPRPAQKPHVSALRPRTMEMPAEDPMAEDEQIDPYGDAPTVASYDKVQAPAAEEAPRLYQEAPAVPEETSGVVDNQEPALFDDPPLQAAPQPVEEEVPQSGDFEDTPKSSESAAVPHPVRPRDAFIPPRPVRPEELKRGNAPAAEPFRNTEKATSAAAPTQETTKPNLFRRVTGLGLNTKPQPTASTAEPSLVRTEDRQASPATGSTEPKTAPAAPRTMPAPAPAPRAAAPVQQANADLAPSKAEEEMLEIPAFLRRQAN